MPATMVNSSSPNSTTPVPGKKFDSSAMGDVTPDAACVALATGRVDSCFHCGLALNTRVDDSSLSWVSINGELRPMCCPGCAMAAELIASGGLEYFYRYRTSSALEAGNTLLNTPDVFAEYDSEDLQAEFVQRECEQGSTVNTVKLVIGGMSCAACSWLLEKYLAVRPGVKAVTVNLAEERMCLSWYPDRAKLSELMAAISQLGYSPRVYVAAREYQILKAENRQFLLRLGAAGLLMMQTGMFALAMYFAEAGEMQANTRIFLRWASLLLSLPLIFYCARPFFASAWRGLIHHHIGMDAPVSLAIAIGFLASALATISNRGEVYFDSIAMFTFILLLGRYLERRVRQSGKLSSLSLDELLPVVANRLEGNGNTAFHTDCETSGETSSETKMVAVVKLQAGDQVLVKAGERIPCDGIVLRGDSSVDEASFTGESQARSVCSGDKVSAGTLNLHQTLVLQVQAVGVNTQLFHLFGLVEKASAGRSPVSGVADRIAVYFVAVVLLSAAAAATYWFLRDQTQWVAVAIAVLIVSCPCALSLASPIAQTVASHWLRARGFLVTREGAIESMSGIDTVVFDKTGTLTTGNLELRAASFEQHEGVTDCWRIARSLESLSEHPIARAFELPDFDIPIEKIRGENNGAGDAASTVVESAKSSAKYSDCPGRAAGLFAVENFLSHTGLGIEGVICGERYFLGSQRYVSHLVEKEVIAKRVETQLQRHIPEGKQVYLFNEFALMASFSLTDLPRDTSPELVRRLMDNNIDVHILSGDSEPEVARVSSVLGVKNYRGNCTPEQKVAQLRSLQRQGRRVMMVGDGLNDIPVLVAAELSVAVSNAADLAKSKADCYFLHDNIAMLADCLRFAQIVRRTVQQNLFWALFYNATALPLAALALIPPWMAAIGMSASSLVVLLNANRLHWWRDNKAMESARASLTLRDAPLVPGNS